VAAPAIADSRAQDAGALPHHVGHLVREEALAGRAMRLVRPRVEGDVVAHGESDRRHARVDQVGLGVGVDARVAEADPEDALSR